MTSLALEIIRLIVCKAVCGPGGVRWDRNGIQRLNTSFRELLKWHSGLCLSTHRFRFESHAGVPTLHFRGIQLSNFNLCVSVDLHTRLAAGIDKLA